MGEFPHENVSLENSNPRDWIAMSKAMEKFARQMMMDLHQTMNASPK